MEESNLALESTGASSDDIAAATKAVADNKKPEEVAAMLCTMYLPAFRAHVAKLSNNALRRLIYNLVQFPLENGDYNPRNTVEKNAFLIGDRLLSSKYMMVISTFLQSQQITQGMEEAVTEAAKYEENKEGVANE